MKDNENLYFSDVAKLIIINSLVALLASLLFFFANLISNETISYIVNISIIPAFISFIAACFAVGYLKITYISGTADEIRNSNLALEKATYISMFYHILIWSVVMYLVYNVDAVGIFYTVVSITAPILYSKEYIKKCS